MGIPITVPHRASFPNQQPKSDHIGPASADRSEGSGSSLSLTNISGMLSCVVAFGLCWLLLGMIREGMYEFHKLKIKYD